MWQYRGRIEQLNRTESQEINTYSGGQVVFLYECQDNPMGGKVIFSTNGARTTGRPQAKG